MTTHTRHISPALVAFGTPIPRDLDEIERSLYVLPTWRLVHPQLGRVELTNHPAYLTTLLMLLEAGYEYESEMLVIGKATTDDTPQTRDARSQDTGLDSE